MSTMIFEQLLRWWNEGQNDEEFCVIEVGHYRSLMKIFFLRTY
jgi:hypothetical protein